ncbi:hypothetical protein EU528_03475 [Candidatus Thorarchaeota archaeon]|nr:MAG: hypothetical protein EU528_03475 [Candidatus Thorarchaeota archaeon]
MSDESSKTTVDVERLERQIGNLRCSITILIILVIILSGYIILQPYLQSIHDPFFGMLFILAIVFLPLIACLSANDKR